jgi:NTP pyrophosphatase (non-canonical NTP hydrolase)
MNLKKLKFIININHEIKKMNQDIKRLQSKISSFCEERDWDKFHTPKNLAISICLEAAELLENFQWAKEDLILNKDNVVRISDEIADVLIYSIRLCEILGLDPIDIANKKIEKNGVKYPVKLSKGKSEKYTDLK